VCVFIFTAAVGKSALLSRFSENTFLESYTSTIGIDFNSRMIRVDKAVCKLEIWDTAGQERFSTITANYYRGAQGALLVYDITLKQSFDNVQNWFDRVRAFAAFVLDNIMREHDVCNGCIIFNVSLTEDIWMTTLLCSNFSELIS
jgi:small GTP-binding protein